MIVKTEVRVELTTLPSKHPFLSPLIDVERGTKVCPRGSSFRGDPTVGRIPGAFNCAALASAVQKKPCRPACDRGKVQSICLSLTNK